MKRYFSIGAVPTMREAEHGYWVAFDEAQTVIDAQAARIAELEVGAEFTGDIVSDLTETRDALKSELARAEALAAEWQQSARDAQVEVAELRTKIDSLAQRHLSRGDQLAASKARIEELEASLASASLGAFDWSEDAALEKARAESAESELAQLRERVAKAATALKNQAMFFSRDRVDAALEALRGE